jgi:hypothetical protein
VAAKSRGLGCADGARGTAIAGARGAAWSIAIAALAGAVVWWFQLTRAIAEHEPAPAPSVYSRPQSGLRSYPLRINSAPATDLNSCTWASVK